MHLRPSWRTAVLSVVLLPLVAVATSQLPHTLAQRAQASDRVAVVEVVDRRTVLDGPERFHTETQLKVIDEVRGSGPALVTLLQLGGTHAGRTQHIPGDADFAVGERALVFLHCRQPQRCVLVSMGEGKQPVVDQTAVVVHDMFTGTFTRRPLAQVLAELRAVPPGLVRGPFAPPAVTPAPTPTPVAPARSTP
jgi:hypothetical protein